MTMMTNKTGLAVTIALFLCISVAHVVAALDEEMSSQELSEKQETVETAQTTEQLERPQIGSDAGGGRVEGESGREVKDQRWMQDAVQDVDVPWERMIFGLFFVIVLVCVGVYLLKKFGGARFGNGQYMNVLETVPLGPDKSLALVRIGERVILLAIQKENMEKVAEFAAEDMPEPRDVERESGAGFGGILDGLMKGQK